MREDFTVEHMAWCNGGRRRVYRVEDQHKYSVYGYKTDTKCAHSVRGRPTLKDEERFRNGLVRKPYERSLYERTFMLQAGVTFSRSQILCYVTICHMSRYAERSQKSEKKR